MESKKINQLATELAPDLSDLTIIGDPTTGISKKITLSQMASLFTGTVEEYANFAAFPLVGVADTIYVAKDTNVIYRWDSTAYVVLSPNIIASLVFNDANGFDGNIALVGSVATLTITTALTTGSVGFIGASGALLQDNANFFWDDTNNRLGLGTNAPTTALDVFGSGIIGRINGTSTNNAFLGFSSAGTNKWSIGNVQSDHRFRIFSEANSAELISVLQTGEFGIGIANPTTKLHIDGAASALIANLDANVSVAKSISFRSDNSNRINLEVSGTESGSNAGANFFIRRYSDAGSLIDTPLTITRSTGAIDLSTALTATSGVFSSTLTATQLTLSTFASGRNLRLSSNPTGIEFFNSAGAVRNWQISAQSINDQSLDFTASTANGGTTYTTPLLSLQGVTSRATITGDLLVKKSGAPQAIFSVDGTTGLFFRDGTNAAWKSWQIATSYNDGSDLSFMPSTNTSGAPTWGASTVVFQGNGRVGIGAISPNYTLHIDSNTTLTRFQITNSTTGQGGGVGLQIIQSGLDASITNRSNGYLSFETLGIERMRITSAGWSKFTNNGTYSSIGGTFHQFNSDDVDDVTLQIVASSTSKTGNVLESICARAAANTYSLFACYSGSSSLQFTIRGDGLIVGPGLISTHTTSSGANLYADPANGAIYRSTSSIKYKKNIEDYSKGLDIVMQLRPVTYEGKNEIDEGKIFAGFIAEEIHDIGLTEYVQYAEDGTPDALAYQNMVALLTKAIQELKAEVDALKSK